MVKIEFYLSEEDTERLFAIKEDECKNSLSANEYAGELLSQVLNNIHPKKVKFNENGERIK